MAKREEPKKPTLSGYQYLTQPIGVLVKHPDFSQHAYRVMLAISQMTSSQIEEITIAKGTH